MSHPPPIQIEQAEVEQLIDQAQRGLLDGAAQKRIVPLLRTLVWLQQTLLETRISLSRLKKILFGKRTEKRSRTPKDLEVGSDEVAEGCGDPPHQRWGADAPPPLCGTQPSTKAGGSRATPRRGHGRLGAAEYPGAETVFCPHEEFHPGYPCPACQRSRLYPMQPLVRLQLTGQPLALATRYERERLRCSGCGYITAAVLPVQARGERYCVSLKVTLALAHYHLGLPLQRIEGFQALMGMPLPDATQWQLVEQVADTGWVVYEYLKKLSANQTLVYQDDTGARVLSLIRENRAEPPPERTGMHTTALRFEGPHSICVYFTGRRHAGENLDAILAHRDPELAPIQWMSDGLAANTPKQHQDRAIQINCIVHGRRQFVDLEMFFPSECTRVIEAIAELYKHEAHCQAQNLTAAQRLAYHQQHSRPVMQALKAWMQKQFEDKRVEPNSRLGAAFNYLLKRWDSLTRFLEISGAPLDNNAAERALKMIQRYRKNSLFYRNEHGARVGDILTSLIETCRLAAANPMEYLSALLKNRSAVFQDPGAWLPWNYRDNLERAPAPGLLGHPPPVLVQPGDLGVAVPQ